MNPLLKRYYLMQLAYWCQQLLVLALGLEKPRKDFTELIIHHIVTIWLIGYGNDIFFLPVTLTRSHILSWSYAISLTLIGNAGKHLHIAIMPTGPLMSLSPVFITMDVSDVILAVRSGSATFALSGR